MPTTTVPPSPRRASRMTMLCAALALFGAQAAFGQTDAGPRDADALKRLTQMGDYLRSLKSFTLKAQTTKDEVLESGQKLQFAGTLQYQFAAPDKLRASLRSDRQWRDFYFDGKTATMLAPRMGYYTSVPVQGSVGDLMTQLASKYDIEMPLADLFFWGSKASGLDELQSATLVGPARIDGRECDHFALRQPGVDWQIWVERGARPLPCKLVITTTENPSQPQYSAVLNWQLAAPPAAASFTYQPTKDAKRIEIAAVPGAN